MAQVLKNSQRTGILTIIITSLLVLFVAFLLLKNNRSSYYMSVKPILDQKAQILALATPGRNLTPEVRATLFSYLSGPKILKYNFTPEEKTQIINFLNGKK